MLEKEFIPFNIDICEGCYSNYSEDSDEIRNCSLRPEFNNKPCPCIKCLVKGVCEDACEIFLYFEKEQIRSWKDKKESRG